ncbi:MAG: type II toxin-antitoxin system Phd/YefM family antitoxin [Rhodocyclaceae bacterium]|nr:type II toxin-antitoxin system Phd/YefM family antitoxin [Rhodocyclaceae bacterium]
MQTIKASEFKAKCSTLIDEVARTGEVVCVIKQGKPLAELHPVAPCKQSSRVKRRKGDGQK